MRNPKDGKGYIDALNAGSSSQAGRNFVNLAVMAGIEEINGVDLIALGEQLDDSFFGEGDFDFGVGASAPF